MQSVFDEITFQKAIDPMWIIDVEGIDTYRFISVNETFTTITGWHKKQVIGQPMEKIIPPQSHDLVREKYSQVISTGEIVDYLEESIHPAGIKHGHIRVIPLKNDKGEITQLLGIAHDVTKETLLLDVLIKERDRQNMELTAAAVKGQELERSRVSRELHDNVNQVLTTVKLFTELCYDDKVNPKEVLPKCTSLLVSTINEIRSLSKQLSAPTMGNMSYHESISDLIESMMMAMEVPIKLNMKLNDCKEMETDLHLTIYRILQAQLTNIQTHANAKKVVVNLKIETNHLVLCIEDDGSGFDISKSRKGIGLLNIQSRTQLLNGTFKLNSETGIGTTLEVRFPISISDGVCLPISM